jgi:DNA-binding transcriptional LysR family regulator
MIAMTSISLAHHALTDYNLFVPLMALLEERHVTRAAERCGLSQPAMSRALERARLVFGDELLARRGTRYERTPRGERLFAELRELLPRLDAVVTDARFDPAASRDRFRVVTTDYGGTMLLPDIVAQVATRAPHASVEVTAWSPSAFANVREGRHDLAVIGLDGAAELEFEPLFTDEFVCVIARDHPIGDEPMTLERYASYPHAALAIDDGRQAWIERPLQARGFERRVAFSTPSLVSALLALPGTGLICTISRRWCERFVALADVRIVDPPPDLEPFRYGMAWHARATSDAATWFRGLVRNAAARVDSA